MDYPYYQPPCVSTSPVLAVVVTCHAAYLPQLGDCLQAIELQNINAVKVLCLDGCDFTAPEGWIVVRGEWRCPNPARNEGWRLASEMGCEWCVFWDADNLMPAGYLHKARAAALAAKPGVGVLSPDVLRSHGTWVRFSVSQPAQRDYWAGRERSLSDTASIWRMEALHQCGGFSDGNTMLDDYTLALAVTRLGWTVERLEGHLLLADGDTRSTHEGRGESDLWNNRSFHVVTLFAGRHDILRRWLESAHHVELPPQTHWTLVDDSGCALFGSELQRVADLLMRLPQVRSVRIVAAPKGEKPASWRAIHRRVAALYNMALAGSTHDMILMWEDDVIPQRRDALRRLHQGFLPFSHLAAVGAVYPARCNPKVAVASIECARWGTMPQMTWLAGQKGRVLMGMLGGGFTLWAGHYLSPALPMTTSRTLGWDGSVSHTITSAGGELYLDPQNLCEHLAQ